MCGARRPIKGAVSERVIQGLNKAEDITRFLLRREDEMLRRLRHMDPLAIYIGCGN